MSQEIDDIEIIGVSQGINVPGRFNLDTVVVTIQPSNAILYPFVQHIEM